MKGGVSDARERLLIINSTVNKYKPHLNLNSWTQLGKLTNINKCKKNNYKCLC